MTLPPSALSASCAEHTSAVPCPQAADVAALCAALQSQEEALVWCITRYASLVSGVQLARDLKSLVNADKRMHLSRLPVVMMGLGELLKRDRALMWAYSVFKTVEVSIQRLAGDRLAWLIGDDRIILHILFFQRIVQCCFRCMGVVTYVILQSRWYHSELQFQADKQTGILHKAPQSSFG